MTAAAQESDRRSSEGHLSLSGISVLMALALAAFEVYFFWGGGPNGFFPPERLGFNIAWLIFFYLSFQLVSIPFSIGYREQFVGVLDGLASVVPLVIACVVVIGRPELLGTPERWEAAILLLLASAVDLVGGFAITIGLSRRTIGFGAPAS
jgi:hypothetical protein